ncbi:exopolyphosphatase [Fulvivirga sp. M361]|uniref:Ppx/GppA phosphatase family protein n=1 Tax=Fulvivirga sp. M361 TaxID=2594266 RepID=UPI00117AAF08|nr:exopolyphosphatase [Fulvivirga sp. M361]TRX53776.1 exopolyphosphatase [Fulvivirga sp. M361]
MSLKRVAIIDCGTNTFHLLIAQHNAGQKYVLFQDKQLVKIGEGINDQVIHEEAQKRALNAMKAFRSLIDNYKVSAIFAFATSAFRNAKNGPDLKKKIFQLYDIDINIISGQDEAEHIFWGVNDALDIGKKNSLIMDIGGGSVEFVIAQKDDLLWKQSFEIGAQRLLDLFQRHDPILEEEVNALNEYLSKFLKTLLQAAKKYNPNVLIGSSGTFDTLSEVYCLEKGITPGSEQTETPLTIKAYKNIHAQLIRKNRNERMHIPGMIEIRVDMIVVASCIIDFLLNAHAFNHIRVSTYSLKEGVLAQIVDGKLLR